MSDYFFCYTGPQDIQLDVGKGHVPGVVVTTTEAASGACSLYDYNGAGPPIGPKIFDVMVNASTPITLLFNDRYAPRFKTGVWLHLSDHCYAMIWYPHSDHTLIAAITWSSFQRQPASPHFYSDEAHLVHQDPAATTVVEHDGHHRTVEWTAKGQVETLVVGDCLRIRARISPR